MDLGDPEHLCREMFRAARAAHVENEPRWEPAIKVLSTDGIPAISHVVLGNCHQFAAWWKEIIDGTCRLAGLEPHGRWLYQRPLFESIFWDFYSPRRFAKCPALVSIASAQPVTLQLARRYDGILDPTRDDTSRVIAPAASRAERFVMGFGYREPTITIATENLVPHYPEESGHGINFVWTRRRRRVVLNGQPVFSHSQEIVGLASDGAEDTKFMEGGLYPAYRELVEVGPSERVLYAKATCVRLARLLKRGGGPEAWGHTVMWGFHPSDASTVTIATVRNDFRFNVENHFPELILPIRAWVRRAKSRRRR